MRAVMYGAGNIGRGFIGMLFSQSGYEVTFIDVAEPVIESINKDGKYPVRILHGDKYEDVEVKNVNAVNGNDFGLVAKTIAEADIMATAVGVNILKFIIPNLVLGIKERKNQRGGPLNILLCENQMDVNLLIDEMITREMEKVDKEIIPWYKENIGLIEVSIGRMVPVQTDEMKDGNPMRVCVEEYGFLPADKGAFKGDVPEIKNMVSFDPFDYFVKRKLYVHNMSHATCAYLGMYEKLEYIYQAIDVPDIKVIVQNAMLESMFALAKKYSLDSEDIYKHTLDLLYRFTNSALKDTCKRVGGDPARKLRNTDRLIGSAQTCIKYGISPVYICIGAAGAVYEYLLESGKEQSEENALWVLTSVSELTGKENISELIIGFYKMFIGKASIHEISCYATKLKKQSIGSVV